MKDVISMLKKEPKETGPKLEAEIFDLLLTAACSECCNDSAGGNKQCPPIKLA